ncbi:hypothetical protein L202_05569 [Cryptococcus amylolentus CBS 6039]|uniref:Uncharacterized protein n=1 Tax=Cryptococcus amylolentus CBS 6039 TaxID=1295533 RepID=A0A1E3HKY5_9TREE|nr:hypothetical protein L202_05569 [Cryptococcus amylolentus CBS 6039]ODN77023.1 hypothetical protein L202_05569 [Cryptococcus amylolentus CBS 6039]
MASVETPRPRENRGPVEELIYKRTKALGKKIQRFKAYASQKPESLNADQKSGLASLPQLEGIYRELEDISKQVEYVELEQAGKVRELKEQSKKDAEAHGLTKIEEFQTSLSTPLSLFIRLHSLLHPARPSDHEHLIFGRLRLPSNMKEVVQATDVLRVGRWYDDLRAGGDRGKVVIGILVKGPQGTDEEDDRVHHLLKLLEESDSLPEEAEEEEGQAKEAVATTSQNASRSLTFNFLQDDELVTPADTQTTVIEPPAPTPAPQTTQPPAPKPPAPSAVASFDWAAEDDETSPVTAPAPVLSASQASQPTQPQQPEAKTSNDADADQIIEENVAANSHVLSGLAGTDAQQAPPTVGGQAAAPGPVKTVPSGPKKGRGRGRGGQGQLKSQPQQEQSPAQSSAHGGENGLAADGKQEQTPSPNGLGGRGGRGRGRWGRGRGGGRGGKASSGSTTPVEGKPAPQRQQQPKAPKPSKPAAQQQQQAKPTTA